MPSVYLFFGQPTFRLSLRRNSCWFLRFASFNQAKWFSHRRTKKTYHFTVTATHMSVCVLVCECLSVCGHVADRKQAQWQLMLSAFNLTQRPCCKFTAIMQSSCQLRLRQLAACVSLSQSIRPASRSELPYPVGGPKNLLPFCSYNVSISRVICVCTCVWVCLHAH